MKRKMMCAVLVAMLSAPLFTGCGGGDGGGGGGTGTAADAEAVGAGVLVADIAGLIATLPAPAGMTTKGTANVGKAVVVDVTIVETSLGCNEGTFSESTGTIGTATLNGTDIASDGSGSCLVKTDGEIAATAADLDETLNCTSFNPGSEIASVAMSGLLGFFPVMTFSGTTANVSMFNIGTKGLTGTVNGKNCDMVVGVDGSATIDISGTGHIVIDGGCISVCGTNFTITGTIDF